jgi:signal transduction histidine kinase
MLNWSDAALRGKPAATLIGKGSRDAYLDGLSRVVRLGGVQHMLWRMRPRQKPEFEAEVTASLVRNTDGKPASVRWLIRDITHIREAQQQLFEYQRRLRALTVELSLTEERERRKIAIEIHDRISQNLAMAKLRMASIQTRFSPDTKARVDADFYDALFLLEQTLEDTRTLTFELSPPILYELGLVSALQWLAEQLSRRHGIRVVIDGSAAAAEQLGDDLRSLLFRSVRELLINVIKHAKATAARVSIRGYDGGVRVTVADDGHGFDPVHAARNDTQTGFGLFSMRTRLEQIGGKVEISSVSDSGTRVTLSAPIGTSISGGGIGHGN